MQALQSQLKSWREHLSPVTHVSSFKETGMVTPEEFVRAGDYLTDKFPTWRWESGDASRVRDFLPADKQYLVTKRVPSLRRAESLRREAERQAERPVRVEGEEDEWVATDIEKVAEQKAAEIPDIDEGEHSTPKDGDGLPDLEDMAIEDDDDPSAAAPNTVATRTYDIYITYDKYYRTPRLWLFGWSEHGQPLSVQEVYEDVSSAHAGKTVTMETFPYSQVGGTGSMASVHPCQHSAVMKVFIEKADDAARSRAERRNRQGSVPASEDQGVRVDQYLVIFLKFISSVMPTVEGDYTMQY